MREGLGSYILGGQDQIFGPLLCEHPYLYIDSRVVRQLAQGVNSQNEQNKVQCVESLQRIPHFRDKHGKGNGRNGVPLWLLQQCDRYKYNGYHAEEESVVLVGCQRVHTRVGDPGKRRNGWMNGGIY